MNSSLNSSKSCISAIRQGTGVLPIAILRFSHLHYYAPFPRFIRFSSYLCILCDAAGLLVRMIGLVLHVA